MASECDFRYKKFLISMKYLSIEGISPVVLLRFVVVDGLCPFVNFRGSTLESINL